MKFLLFFSFLFLLYCVKVFLSQKENNRARYAVIKNFAIFLFIFFYIATVKTTVHAATWSFSKAAAVFTISPEEILFIQDDTNYYFKFETSNNPYGHVSGTSFVISNRPDLDLLNHTTTVGSSNTTYKTTYKSGGTIFGTFSCTPKASDINQVNEYPSICVYDTSVTSGIGIDSAGRKHEDVCHVMIDRFTWYKIPKSKITTFRYVNLYGSKDYSGNSSTGYKFGLSHAVDLMSIVDHECDFKVRYLDETYHDYYCSTCRWSKDKKEHAFDLPDVFGFENRKCECGLCNKSTIRLSLESTDGKNISKGDAIDFNDSYKKINQIDINGTPGTPFTLSDLNIEEIPGYIFLGLDPPLPDVFPSESIEYKLVYEPIKYKVLYSHDNLSNIETRKLSAALKSKGSARDIRAGEVEQIERDYNISLDGLVYCMVQDCVYDREFSLPTYLLYSYTHLGWGNIKNNLTPLYSTSKPVKNLTLVNNDVVVLIPAFSYVDTSRNDNETWNGNSGGGGSGSSGGREGGSSNIIDNSGGGPGGSGGSGSGSGSGGGSGGGPGDDLNNNNNDNNNNVDNKNDNGNNNDDDNNQNNGNNKDSALTNSDDKSDAKNSDDDKNSNKDDLQGAGGSGLDGNDGNGGDAGTDGSDGGGTGGSGLDNNLLGDLNLFSAMSSFGKNSFISFLSNTSFRKNFETHLEREKLALENLRRQKISALGKMILQRTLIFLTLLMLIIFIRDIKARQKVKKHI